MKAVIMAGGKGTRLYPLTKRVPKPMVPLLDRPVMEYTVDLLARHGVTDIAVTVCYLAECIMNHFGDGRNFGVRMHYVTEPVPLGTAGGVKNVGAFLDETFVVMSGDGLTDIDLSAALEFHKERGALATLILSSVMCPREFGVVETDASGRIQAFIEKPTTWVEGRAYHVNTGIYIMEPQVLRCIPAGSPYDFGRDLFPWLLAGGYPLYACHVNGYWSDIGTLRQCYQTQIDMVDGLVDVNLPFLHEVGSAMSVTQ